MRGVAKKTNEMRFWQGACVVAILVTVIAFAPRAFHEAQGATQPEIIEIKERLFIAGCNDVMANPGDYKNRLVKLEGMYTPFQSAPGKTIHCVTRNSPGCCGGDGVVGFEFTWSGVLPKDNDWIEVTGSVVVKKNPYGYDTVLLKAVSVKTLNKRGREFVTN